MKLLKCKNGAMLMFDTSTEAYWLVTEICGTPSRLFAGGHYDKAIATFNYYSRKGD